MNLFIKNHFSSIDQLEKKLKNELPDYTYLRRGKRILIARRSIIAAAVITVKKKHIQVSGNFPEFYYALIFAVITIAFGIIIPVVLYFIFIHKKLKRAEKEVAKVLSSELN
jgi:hypothetical protein